MGEQFNLFCPYCKAITVHIVDQNESREGDLEGFQYGFCEKCRRRSGRVPTSTDESTTSKKNRVTENRKVYVYSGGTIQRLGKKVGRNDPCPCGSGKKFKSCHDGQQRWGWDLRVVEKRKEAK